MSYPVCVYDPTVADKLSLVRGVGRYLQILHENFPEFRYINNTAIQQYNNSSVFINPFFNFLQSPLTMRRIAQKQVTVIHDLIPLKYPSHFPIGLKGKINVWLNKRALKNYNTIITVSKAVKADIIKILGVDEKKIKVVYHCLPKIFTTNSNTTIQQFNNRIIPDEFCLYVGDATWNKNLVSLAKAIKKINVTCRFVGKVFHPPTREFIDSLTNKWQSELKEFYNEVKDDKRFIFTGYVPDVSLLKLYQQATVNILPSRDEGFGFSWLESASQRCPTVMNDIEVFHEIAGDSSIFCNANDPNELANAIGELYFHKEARDLWGKKAYNRSRFFSVEKFRKDFSRALNI